MAASVNEDDGQSGHTVLKTIIGNLYYLYSYIPWCCINIHLYSYYIYYIIFIPCYYTIAIYTILLHYVLIP